MMGSTDTLSFAPAISQPTLALAGSLDTLAPVEQHSAPIAAAIPGAHLNVFEGYGHLLKLEAPSGVSDAIRAHIRSVEGSKP